MIGRTILSVPVPSDAVRRYWLVGLKATKSLIFLILMMATTNKKSKQLPGMVATTVTKSSEKATKKKAPKPKGPSKNVRSAKVLAESFKDAQSRDQAELDAKLAKIKELEDVISEANSVLGQLRAEQQELQQRVATYQAQRALEVELTRVSKQEQLVKNEESAIELASVNAEVEILKAQVEGTKAASELFQAKELLSGLESQSETQRTFTSPERAESTTLHSPVPGVVWTNPFYPDHGGGHPLNPFTPGPVFYQTSQRKSNTLEVCDVVAPRTLFLFESGSWLIRAAWKPLCCCLGFLLILMTGFPTLKWLLDELVFACVLVLCSFTTMPAACRDVALRLAKKHALAKFSAVSSPWIMMILVRLSPYMLVATLFLCVLCYFFSFLQLKSCKLVLFCVEEGIFAPNARASFDAKVVRRPDHSYRRFKPLIEIVRYADPTYSNLIYTYYDAPHYFGVSNRWTEGVSFRVISLLETLIPTLLSRKTLHSALKDSRQTVDRILRLAEGEDMVVEDLENLTKKGESLLQDTSTYCCARLAGTAALDPETF